VKVLLDVGQIDASVDFNRAVTSNLSTLITNIMREITSKGFDGVDLDWESNWDGTKAVGLFSGLRTALGTKLLTSAALVQLNADYAGTNNLYTYLDRVEVMTYDMTHNGGAAEWFNEPLYRKVTDMDWSADYVVKERWVASGIPIGKISMAIPFYGYTVTGGGVTDIPRASYNGGNPPAWNQIAYAAILSTYDISSPTWDTDSLVPWISVAGGYLTFDNAQSVGDKIAYMKANAMGGWFAWEFSKDYVSSASPPHPLIVAAGQATYTSDRPEPPTALQILRVN
jgi:chitinase